MDFREIAGGALPTKRDDNIPGRIVLQLQKTRNISAPKSNEDSKAAPRFLQLELTDGQTTINALELENVSVLNMNLPPGTKIYFRSERLQLMQGFLILRSSEIQVLGGRVEPLVEKWELARTMLKYARSGRRMSGASGPPPWIPFGTKVEASISNDRNFKSLQAAGADGKETKENEEFNAMRSEAIAEASKAGAKKVFQHKYIYIFVMYFTIDWLAANCFIIIFKIVKIQFNICTNQIGLWRGWSTNAGSQR